MFPFDTFVQIIGRDNVRCNKFEQRKWPTAGSRGGGGARRTLQRNRHLRFVGNRFGRLP